MDFWPSLLVSLFSGVIGSIITLIIDTRRNISKERKENAINVLSMFMGIKKRIFELNALKETNSEIQKEFYNEFYKDIGGIKLLVKLYFSNNVVKQSDKLIYLFEGIHLKKDLDTLEVEIEKLKGDWQKEEEDLVVLESSLVELEHGLPQTTLELQKFLKSHQEIEDKKKNLEIISKQTKKQTNYLVELQYRVKKVYETDSLEIIMNMMEIAFTSTTEALQNDYKLKR